VSTSGTRLDRDRPTRKTAWPGEAVTDPVDDVLIADRDADFVQFIVDDVTSRRDAGAAFYGNREPSDP